MALDVAKECRSTSVDIEGPYYVDGAPFRKDPKICQQATFAHDRLYMQGSIFSSDDCETPLAADLDIWQADMDGKYSVGEKDQFFCRAKIVTDNNGYFQFESLMPGRYDDGGFRPAHIHFKIIPHNKSYRNITTQLYFENDNFLAENDSCKRCHSGDPTITTKLEHKKDIKTYVGKWEVFLPKIGKESNVVIMSRERDNYVNKKSNIFRNNVEKVIVVIDLNYFLVFFACLVILCFLFLNHLPRRSVIERNIFNRKL
ncbi:hypothetical protein HK099_006410 [Clydaea vesicula]|uniref:Intradiol ring-cleavage dioxygenases domain-containing protein n=1 Tax=Clydaea vesicula TaxID=447962 RepID=A0AAD5XY65_9FUNG|nr:hypothetical protein HK099_006410 [Clydaea vesicula]